MFIRHAEKPDKHQKGVTPAGEHDEHSLSVRGWTRAGALAALFADTTTRTDIATPGRVIATAPSDSYRSKREHDTALPTAERLGIPVEAQAIPEHYSHLVTGIEKLATPTLVVWHHGKIPDFVRAFPLANAHDVPDSWPEDRFDLVWVLHPSVHAYEWREVNQGLLDKDVLERATS